MTDTEEILGMSDSEVQRLVTARKKHLSDPEHPIWSAVRYACYLTAITVVLYSNASDFDVTEVNSIMLIGAAMAGFETLTQFLKWRAENGVQ